MDDTFMVSQIATFTSESDVNEWLKKNHHLDIVNVNMVYTPSNQREFLVHYKIKAKLITNQ
jgi:hypothetical protein